MNTWSHKYAAMTKTFSVKTAKRIFAGVVAVSLAVAVAGAVNT
jgi:hypothetical protein